MVAPAGSTFLTRLLLVSAIYRLPSGPVLMLSMELPNCALSGGPPSPLNPTVVPPPAQVWIFPSVVTRRMATGAGDLLVCTRSVKYTFPDASTATLTG